MKKNKLFICGIAVGLVIAMGLSAFGAPVSEKITAYINHTFTFEFDGAKKDLPDGYHVLVYEGRSYVPARFVAENLGATVDWNDETKVISIHSPEPVVVTVPAVSVPDGDDKTSEKPSVPSDAYNYKALPQTKDFDGFRISALSYFEDAQNIGDRLYLKITNTSEGNDVVKLDQIQTKYIVDDKEYILSGKDAANFDVKWYNDIGADQETEGYLRLPSTIKDVKNIHVAITVKVTHDFKSTDQVITFDIAL